MYIFPRLLQSWIGKHLPSQGEWQDTIEKTSRNVVAIRYCRPCPFDTHLASTGEATGCVVDSEKGYILTNRHVVGSGPFWGHCVFENSEEVHCYPVYRDPVHDFGILQYDPKAVKYMQLEGLKLSPDQAKVGVEIRVVGNDAGEKISILSGIISRLDRNAPEYNAGYRDFNTCYYQANTASSGGSSGSPVVSKDGSAIALQAGGRSDGPSTAYFLPLDRPLRALQCIQQGKPVSRGDIQTEFLLRPFVECRQLGLSSDWEAATRKAFPGETSMLVAEIVLPKGPSDGKIQPGDVLIKVNGETLTDFLRLDDILDSNVGKTINVLLQRGGEDVEVNIEVGDLHKITPDRFVSVAGGSFHDLSYQHAMLHAIAIQGVFVCERGGSFFLPGPSDWIIQTVDGKEVPDLARFIEIMKDIPDKARIVVTCKRLSDLHTPLSFIVCVNHHWSSKMRLAIRNDTTGMWDFENLGDPPPPVPPRRRSAAFPELPHMPTSEMAYLIRSFVHIECRMPFKLDGFPANICRGMGLVFDAEKGLVLISRAIVPYNLCDIVVTIADTINVDGKVVFMHPLHNYAVIQYSPSLVDAPVESARLSTEHLTKGAKTSFLGYSPTGGVFHATTTVTGIAASTIPANETLPCYRALNIKVISIDSDLGQGCNSGVLVAPDGAVQALWLSYRGGHDGELYLGFDIAAVLPVIQAIQKVEPPKVRSLSSEFAAIQLSVASDMGVSDEWIKKVTQADPLHHQVFMVMKRTFERFEPTESLQMNDIVLMLNSKMCTTISDFDGMYSEETLDAVIIRNREERHLKLQTVPTDDVETDHFVSFCGAILHRPHHAVRQQITKLHSEVYVSSRIPGSPAFMSGMAPTNFITHVNDQPTGDLKEFIEATRKIPNNTYFRLRAVTFDDSPWVIRMKKDDHYFPMIEWIKDSNELRGWRRVTYEGNDVLQGEATDSVPTVAETDVD